MLCPLIPNTSHEDADNIPACMILHAIKQCSRIFMSPAFHKETRDAISVATLPGRELSRAFYSTDITVATVLSASRYTKGLSGFLRKHPFTGEAEKIHRNRRRC
jgi:hypothetical protein